MKNFLLGLIVGLAAGIVGASFLSSRYKVESNGPYGVLTIRTDTWTGKSWEYRYTETNGEKVWFWDPMIEKQ